MEHSVNTANLQSFIKNNDIAMSIIANSSINNSIKRFIFNKIKELYILNNQVLSQCTNDRFHLNDTKANIEILVTLAESLIREKNINKNLNKYIEKINNQQYSLAKINNTLNKESFNIDTNNNGILMNKIKIYSSVKIDNKEFKLPAYLKALSFFQENSGKVIFGALSIMFIFYIFSLIYDSKVEIAQEDFNNSKIYDVAFTPENIQKMLETEYFTKDTFRSYVIFLEKTNKEKDPTLQWNISFNDSKRLLFLEKKDLSPEQCKTMVALKEISFDSAGMKINGISAPINHWTASDSPQWTQQTNQELCTLKNNTINLGFSSQKTKRDLSNLRSMKEENYNFLIQQHEIAAKYKNSPKLKEALKKKIFELNQLLTSKQNQNIQNKTTQGSKMKI